VTLVGADGADGADFCCETAARSARSAFLELPSGVDSSCVLYKHLASVIYIVDAFFTKNRFRLPLSTCFATKKIGRALHTQL
jgi:hypothetical protein